jgi:metal-responsive CopG/Arc/MetJ family transcriptional regulator
LKIILTPSLYDYMKTIAVTIDETTLRLLDELAAASLRPRSRSVLVRIAVREFAEWEQRRKKEIQEHKVLHKHKKLLAPQARPLIAEQARS